MPFAGITAWIGLDLRGVTCREDSNAQVSQRILRKSNLVIKGVMNAYLYFLGSTRIYSLLILFDLVMGWVIDWVVGGPGPDPSPFNSMICWS